MPWIYRWTHQVPVLAKLPAGRGPRLIKTLPMTNESLRDQQSALEAQSRMWAIPKTHIRVTSQGRRLKASIGDKQSSGVKRADSGARCLDSNPASSTS